MELAEVEARLGMVFPEGHRHAMLDPQDRIHNACDLLVPSSPHKLLRLIEVNEFLHAPDNWNCWPAFLVAFASNGCGDYFAYDLRVKPPRIIYIDPDLTVAENLEANDKLVYPSFDAWYAETINGPPAI